MGRSAQLVQAYFKYRSKIRLWLSPGSVFLWLQSKITNIHLEKKKKKADKCLFREGKI